MMMMKHFSRFAPIAKYYYCLNNGNGGWNIIGGECPPGTVFDEPYQRCDYPMGMDNNPCSKVSLKEFF